MEDEIPSLASSEASACGSGEIDVQLFVQEYKENNRVGNNEIMTDFAKSLPLPCFLPILYGKRRMGVENHY